MAYEVIKTYNNNIVLAKDADKEVVLISKGIGFGKKAGDTIQEGKQIEKIFHASNLQDGDLSLYAMNERKKEIEELISQIIDLAETKIGKLSKNTEKALVEHIEFAIERLDMGLTIDNPFIDQILSLYQTEYEIAAHIRELINERLKVDIGDEEQGFIALHIYSARTNKSIKETMKMTRMYNTCMEIINKNYHLDCSSEMCLSSVLFYNFKLLIKATNGHQKLNMPLRKYVTLLMTKSYKVAKEISSVINEECDIILSEDAICYLAIEVEKFTQLL